MRGGSDAAAIESAVAVLEAGEVVGIFPEGGVRREGPWLRGAARMALATGSPLLPVRFLDTAEGARARLVRLPAARRADRRADRRRADGADGASSRGQLTDQLQAAVEALGT